MSRGGGGHGPWHRLRLCGFDPDLLGFRRRLNRFWRLVFSGCRLRLLDGFLFWFRGRLGFLGGQQVRRHVKPAVVGPRPDFGVRQQPVSVGIHGGHQQVKDPGWGGVAGGSLDDVRQVARFNESTACSKHFVDGLHRHVAP